MLEVFDGERRWRSSLLNGRTAPGTRRSERRGRRVAGGTGCDRTAAGLPDQGAASGRARPLQLRRARRSDQAAGLLDNGPTVSHGTIQNIRSGRVTNPGVESLQAIARFFGVTTAYFTDDAVAEVTIARIREIRESGERAKASDELADALEDQQVRAVAFRLGGLSSNALRGIKGIVEGFREAEGLPAVTADPEPGPAARTS